MTLKGLSNNLVRDREEGSDVEEYYEVKRLIGEGSISNIYVVQKKNVGGSARKEEVNQFSLFDFFCCRTSSSKESHEKHDYNMPPNNESSNQAIYAMKQINKNFINKECLNELRNEINIFKALDHPNILRAYEAFEKEKNISIIMEYLTGGDLYSRHPYTEKQSATIVSKILSAVCFMHDNKIFHRDLTYENIMFANSSPDAEIKLIDFGYSTKFISKNQYFTDRVGTIYSMAPEVLDEEYTSKCDLWSVGVVTYMLLSGKKPFWGKTIGEAAYRIKNSKPTLNGKEWAHVSNVAKDFVMKLLEKNPKKRYSAKQALNHQWVNDIDAHTDQGPTTSVMEDGHESLVRYADSGEFKKLALNVIAHQSNAEDLLEIRKMFDQYDTEKNGQITFTEFREALSQFDYTEEKLDKMFHSIDVNHNGSIFYCEFLAATLETQGRIAEERLAEAFDRLDDDGSGFISKEDLRGLLGNHGSEEYINQLINEVDHEKDGKISYKEFLSIFQEKKGKEIEEILHDDKSHLGRGNLFQSIMRHFTG